MTCQSSQSDLGAETGLGPKLMASSHFATHLLTKENNRTPAQRRAPLLHVTHTPVTGRWGTGWRLRPESNRALRPSNCSCA